MIECGASTNKSQPKVSEDPDRLSRQHSGYIHLWFSDRHMATAYVAIVVRTAILPVVFGQFDEAPATK